MEDTQAGFVAMIVARLDAAERKADELAATIAEMKVDHSDAIGDCAVDVEQIMNYLGFEGGMRLDPDWLFSRFTDGYAVRRSVPSPVRANVVFSAARPDLTIDGIGPSQDLSHRRQLYIHRVEYRCQVPRMHGAGSGRDDEVAPQTKRWWLR